MYKVEKTIKNKEEENKIFSTQKPVKTLNITNDDLLEKNYDMSCKFMVDGKEQEGVILALSTSGKYVVGYNPS